MREFGLVFALTAAIGISSAFAQTALLNVSYDPNRELTRISTPRNLLWPGADWSISAWASCSARHDLIADRPTAGSESPTIPCRYLEY